MMNALLIIAAYLIGGIPFSFLAAKTLKGIDLRTVGSGNVGATNASRLFPKPWSFIVFVICFILDALKGFLPALFLAPLLVLPKFSPAERSLLLGMAAVIGHVYTPYLRFKGGKGVATSAGAFMAASPVAVLITAGIGIATILITRFVSVGSILMAIVLPILIRLRQPEETYLFLLSILVGLFIIFKHRENIRRLIAGREARLFSRQFDMSKEPHREFD